MHLTYTTGRLEDEWRKLKEVDIKNAMVCVTPQRERILLELGKILWTIGTASSVICLVSISALKYQFES